MKIRKVVVGVDFSSASIQAAQWAATHLGDDVSITLVHVVDLPEVPDFLAADVPGAAQLKESTKASAAARLEAVAAGLAPRLANMEVAIGSATAEIAALVAREHADIVVVGEHGPSRGLWDTLGTTAERLIHDLEVPLLITRAAGDDPPSMILAPVDDKPGPDAVLAWAGFFAEMFNSELAVLHVVDAQLTGRVRLISTDSASREFEERLRKSTEQWLAEQIDAAGLDKSRTLKLVAIGDPRAEVLAAADRVRPDLIVMGSRAGPMSRVLLGSVAKSVLRQARCSVCILPRGIAQ